MIKKCAICDSDLQKGRRKYCTEDCRLESKRKTARQWNKDNKKDHAQHQRDHKSRDVDLFKKKEKEYYKRKNKECPGYFANKTAKRTAVKLNATLKWLSEDQKKDIQAFYTYADKLSTLTDIPHSVDHISPLQGVNSSGLHVPWNLQVLTSSENSSKSNGKNRKIVYLLCGQSGVGKTTLAKKYEDIFTVAQYDKLSDDKLDQLLRQVHDKPILLDISIKISTIINKYNDDYFIRPIFLIEPIEVVKKHILGRNKNISNIHKRYNRIVSLANKFAYYSGNIEDVRLFLNELK